MSVIQWVMTYRQVRGRAASVSLKIRPKVHLPARSAPRLRRNPRPAARTPGKTHRYLNGGRVLQSFQAGAAIGFLIAAAVSSHRLPSLRTHGRMGTSLSRSFANTFPGHFPCNKPPTRPVYTAVLSAVNFTAYFPRRAPPPPRSPSTRARRRRRLCCAEVNVSGLPLTATPWDPSGANSARPTFYGVGAGTRRAPCPDPRRSTCPSVQTRGLCPCILQARCGCHLSRRFHRQGDLRVPCRGGALCIPSCHVVARRRWRPPRGRQ